MDDKKLKSQALQFPKALNSKIITTVASYTAPLFFGDLNKIDDVNNGTIFFVNLGKDTIGVSAAHVYNGYLERKIANKSIICQICNHRFAAEENLIDINTELDIVTFRIDKKYIDKIRKTIHAPEWPPTVRPRKNNIVAFVGFPGVEKIIIKNSNTINFGKAYYLMVVESVNDRHITCLYSEATEDLLGLGTPPKNYDLGGISGAPLLLIQESPVISWSLCGVVNQASRDLEMVTAKYADFILPDGHIKKL